MHQECQLYIKGELLEFHNCFFECDPYTRTVEQNWTKFKSAVTDTVLQKNVPFKTIRPNSKVPWINKDIKRDVKKRKRYYNIAKGSKAANDWNAYHRIKNSINCKIKTALTNYYTRMFDNSLNGNRRKFWKYVRAQRKDNHNISTLVVDGKPITELRCKANALNNYFESVFTKENLTNIPTMNDTNNPENTLLVCLKLPS